MLVNIPYMGALGNVTKKERSPVTEILKPVGFVMVFGAPQC